MGKHESRWEHRRARWEAKQAAKQARREWRAQRRRARRHGPVFGAVYAGAALVCLGLALGGLGWMVFVALGLALRAASALSAPRAQEPLPAGAEGTPTAGPPARAPAPAVPGAPSPTREVDALCDALLAELKEGPGLLREVLHQPEATVEALRRSCHALAAREEELRRLNPPEQTERLERERQALSARVEAERDAVTRARLQGALAALEAQLRQREELRTAAARLSAEHTRLRYVLENLRAQVLRVRSASAASADEAGGLLRSSVAQLQAEMDAVAEALESVAHPPPGDVLPPAAPVSAGQPVEADGPAPRGRVRG